MPRKYTKKSKSHATKSRSRSHSKKSRSHSKKSRSRKSPSPRRGSKGAARPLQGKKCTKQQYRDIDTHKCKSQSSMGKDDVDRFAKALRIKKQRNQKKIAMSRVNTDKTDVLIPALEGRTRRIRRSRRRRSVSSPMMKKIASVELPTPLTPVALMPVEPTFQEVLAYTAEVLPEEYACPKATCRTFLDNVRRARLFPKSVESLQNVLIELKKMHTDDNTLDEYPQQRECWICFYRAYRQLYNDKNGAFPDKDIDRNYFPF